MYRKWTEADRKKIEEMSYFKWCDAGKPEGVDFWHQAEQEYSQQVYGDIQELIEVNFSKKKKPNEIIGYLSGGSFAYSSTPIAINPTSFTTKIKTQYGFKSY